MYPRPPLMILMVASANSSLHSWLYRATASSSASACHCALRRERLVSGVDKTTCISSYGVWWSYSHEPSESLCTLCLSISATSSLAQALAYSFNRSTCAARASYSVARTHSPCTGGNVTLVTISHLLG